MTVYAISSGLAHPAGGVKGKRVAVQVWVAALDLVPDATLEERVARADAVHPDSLARQLIRLRLGIMHQCGLHRSVRVGGEVDLPRGYARHHCDRRRRALLEERHRGLDGAHRVHHVDVEARPPVLLRRSDRERADVGHHDVQPAERTGGVLHPRRERRPVTDVDRAAHDVRAPVGQLRDRRLHIGLRARAERYGRALGGESFDDRAADSLGTAGYEGPKAGELKVHGGLPTVCRLAP